MASRRQIAASPGGQRQGILAGRYGDYQLTISIEPKLWRESVESPHLRFDWSVDQREVMLVLREKQRLVIHCHHPEQKRIIDELLANAERQKDTYEDEDDDEEAKAKAKPLIAEEVPDNSIDVPASSGPLSKMIPTLDFRYGVMPSYITRDLTNMEAGFLGHPLFLPLLYRDFAAEMARLLTRVRRGYVERTERLIALRGRIETSDVPAARARGWIPLACTYEEFSHATPLMRVLVTALDQVISARLVPADLQRVSLVMDAARESLGVRRRLGDVHSHSLRVAQRSAARLRLGRLESDWAWALEMARAILQLNVAPISGRAANRPSAAQVSWSSSLQWEVLSAYLLRALFGDEVVVSYGPDAKDGYAFKPPFTCVRKASEIDIVARRRNKTSLLLADAKYKEHNKPSRSDLYQLYYYSSGHFKSATGQPAELMLTYPLWPLADPKPSLVVTHADRADSMMPLFLVKVPFPRPTQRFRADVESWATQQAREMLPVLRQAWPKTRTKPSVAGPATELIGEADAKQSDGSQSAETAAF